MGGSFFHFLLCEIDPERAKETMARVHLHNEPDNLRLQLNGAGARYLKHQIKVSRVVNSISREKLAVPVGGLSSAICETVYFL